MKLTGESCCPSSAWNVLSLFSHYPVPIPFCVEIRFGGTPLEVVPVVRCLAILGGKLGLKRLRVEWHLLWESVSRWVCVCVLFEATRTFLSGKFALVVRIGGLTSGFCRRWAACRELHVHQPFRIGSLLEVTAMQSRVNSKRGFVFPAGGGSQTSRPTQAFWIFRAGRTFLRINQTKHSLRTNEPR